MERGFYSEIVAIPKRRTNVPDKTTLLSSNAAVLQSLYWETMGWKHTPPINRFEFPNNVKITSLKPEEIPEKYKIFFKKSYEPKIQLQTKTPYGTCPKRVAVESLKRLHAHRDLKDLLSNLGIDSNLLIPHSITLHPNKVINLPKIYSPGIPREPFLALNIFDDSEFEIRSPEDWLKMGHSSIIRKPVPGLAFIPDNVTGLGEIYFDWQDVAVLQYDDKSKMYRVRKVKDCPEEGIGIITLATITAASDTENEDYWVPRIYLMFYAEDPLRFSHRIATAIKYRHKAEESLRFCFYIDCMPIEGVPIMEKSSVDKIIEVACSHGLKDLECAKMYIPTVTEEIQRNHQRSLNYLSYMKVAKQNPCLLDEIPDEFKKKDTPFFGYRTRVNYSFNEKRSSFVSRTIWNKTEVILASHDVREEILHVANMSLFQVPISNPMRIEEFEKLQSDRLRQVNMYVHDSWLKKLTHAVQSKFFDCGKGWYNLREKNWFAYQCSKMKSFMNTVNFMMQDTLRHLINDSLEQFTKMFTDTCYKIMDISDDFQWTEHYGSNCMKPLRNPIFEIDLLIVGTSLKFSVDLIKYFNLVVNLFNEGLKATKEIPQIEKFVLEEIFFGEKVVVESVGEHEPHVEAWRTSITTALEKSMKVLQAYVDSYAPVLAFGDIDPLTYVREFERKRKSSQELKQTIEYHLNERKVLDELIPDRLAIGPFQIITRSVRLKIVKQHTALADALLIYFSQMLRSQLDDITNDFLNLKGQIIQKSGNIEDLLDQKVWLESVPETIHEHEDEIKKLKEDYLLLEDFNWVLNYDDFHAYWNTLGLPHITQLLLEERIESLGEDEDLLHKLLIQDQAELSDQLDQIAEKIAGFSMHSDLEKTQAVAAEVRITSKNLKVAQELAKLYNKREGLFNLEITDYKYITGIVQNLEPYELLWLSISEFYKWRERDQSDQLNIERDELERIIIECYEKIDHCRELFLEYYDILKCIDTVCGEIEVYQKGGPSEELFEEQAENTLSDTETEGTSRESDTEGTAEKTETEGTVDYTEADGSTGETEVNTKKDASIVEETESDTKYTKSVDELSGSSGYFGKETVDRENHTEGESSSSDDNDS